MLYAGVQLGLGAQCNSEQSCQVNNCNVTRSSSRRPHILPLVARHRFLVYEQLCFVLELMIASEQRSGVNLTLQTTHQWLLKMPGSTENDNKPMKQMLTCVCMTINQIRTVKLSGQHTTGNISVLGYSWH